MRGGRARAASLVVVLVVLAAALILLPEVRSAERLEASIERAASQPFVREPGMPLVVVTGSSSVRRWPDPASVFPQAQVVNTAVGGTTMAQLAANVPGLVVRFRPDEVVIGSGDNDLARGQAPETVLEQARTVVDEVHQALPQARIVLLAAKPSPLRWHLRSEYLRLNAGFRALAVERAEVEYADVWHRLLDADGDVRPELYVSDGLHLNRAGYRLWQQPLRALAGP
jgi:lysophospholipase L1-like esterase